MQKRRLSRHIATTLVLGSILIGSPVYAMPSGYDIVTNGGEIKINGNQMEINGSGNMAIKWEQFGIKSGEKVTFSNMTNVLNYVTGNARSEIFGALEAQNVNVFLINPNGVLFGKGAEVKAQSLLVSTAAMNDSDIAGFNGTPVLDKNAITADVINLGTIRADKLTVEGANITLGSADKITKYNGTAVTGSEKANYLLQSDGAINVGYEVEKTAALDVGDSQTHNALSNYSSGTVAAGSSKGSVVFSGKKADGTTDNTINDYMLVHDAYELQNIETNRAGKYMLADNIEAGVTKTDSWHSGAGFTPLFSSNNSSQATNYNWFTGAFEGNGYTVKNLYINNSTYLWVGLFGKSAGQITNVNLENIDYSNTGEGRYIGGVLGENVFGGSISNVQVSGKITVNNASKSPYVGGIVGSNGFNTIGGGTAGAGETRSSVKNAFSKVDITVTGSSTQANVGGIAGKNNYYTKSDDSTVNEIGFIENVRNEGSINVDIKQSYAGGIIGTNLGELQQASNIGTVQGKWYTGGIIGSNDGGQNNVFIQTGFLNEGAVSGTQYVGGIVGQNMGGKFSNLGNTGTISGKDNTGGLYVGGIVGQNTRGMVYINDKLVYSTPAITNAYNTGSISGVGSSASSVYVGGITGYQYYGYLTNAYNTGSIYGDKGTASKGYAGGICGAAYDLIENAYNTGSIRITAGTTGSYILAGVGEGISIKNTFFLKPETNSYYNYGNGTEYATTKEFNQAFMDGIASSSDKDSWLVYSGGQTTPQFAAPLQPLEIKVGDIEVEIEQGSSYTELAQTIAAKLAAQGLEIDADKILAAGIDQAGEYNLSDLLYSTQDGYMITVGDGGKLTIKVKAVVSPDPSVGPDVPPADIDKIAGNSQYHAALVNITASGDMKESLKSARTDVMQKDEEHKKIKIKGRGIKI
ncbi:filamentous hemagglutinin N-terminal domain-containing protein [uncultured Phascolarctobacterium sp.]|uniref:two-partner secretion domain-containing protein n=1 Tax=uncultured Phascolarctobacterium sp. TaxID=512296 RepID=UPI0027D9468C|nr:filamentous hemagglutinin N-terminal domain-containing protein [uncultured Phascolarctobacterium sp.]